MRKKLSIFVLLFLMFLLVVPQTTNAEIVPLQPAIDGTIIFASYSENGHEMLIHNWDYIDIDTIFVTIYSVHENYSIVLNITHARNYNYTTGELENITLNYQKTFSNLGQYELIKEKMELPMSNETEIVQIQYLNIKIIFYHKTRPTELPYGFLTKGQLTSLLLISGIQIIGMAIVADFTSKKILDRAKYIPETLFSGLFFAGLPVGGIILGAAYKAIMDLLVFYPWLISIFAFLIITPMASKLHNAEPNKFLFEKLYILESEENIEKEYHQVMVWNKKIVIDPTIKDFILRLFGKYRELKFVGKAEWGINDRAKTFEMVYLYHELGEIKGGISIKTQIDVWRIILFGMIAGIIYLSGYNILFALLGLVIFVKIELVRGTFFVTLASSMYKNLEKVLVDLRRGKSLADAADAQRERANLIESELWTRAIQLQVIREKIRMVYQRWAEGKISAEEAQRRLESLVSEEDKILQLISPEEVIEKKKEIEKVREEEG